MALDCVTHLLVHFGLCLIIYPFQHGYFLAESLPDRVHCFSDLQYKTQEPLQRLSPFTVTQHGSVTRTHQRDDVLVECLLNIQTSGSEREPSVVIRGRDARLPSGGWGLGSSRPLFVLVLRLPERCGEEWH